MPSRSRQSFLPGMEAEPPEPSLPSPLRPSVARQEVSAPLDLSAGALAGKTVYCIDANSLIFQVFHAIPEMTSPRGEPVNAVFGFTRDVLYLLEEKQPDYLFAAFDMPGRTFRDELFADYKATRSAMPEDLIPQFPMIRRRLESLAVPILECD
jgi:DNA polymerase-1